MHNKILIHMIFVWT